MYCESVLVTIAAVVDRYLDLLISLTGSLASSCISFVFPALFETLIYWRDRHQNRKLWLVFIKNSLIMLLGIIGFVAGTVVSITILIQKLIGGSTENGCPA